MAWQAPTWRAALDALRAALDTPMHDGDALVQAVSHLMRCVLELPQLSGEAEHQSLRAELKG